MAYCKKKNTSPVSTRRQKDVVRTSLCRLEEHAMRKTSIGYKLKQTSLSFSVRCLISYLRISSFMNFMILSSQFLDFFEDAKLKRKQQSTRQYSGISLKQTRHSGQLVLHQENVNVIFSLKPLCIKWKLNEIKSFFCTNPAST